jgi:elongation factor Ts
MAISASQVKELRERTGAGMMECKKALVETDGDMDAAIENLRKSGLAKADKKASRTAAEGVIAIAVDAGAAVLVEVNCETDFVGKGDEFRDFAQGIADVVVASKPADVAAVSVGKLASGQSVEERRQELVAKLGENMTVRRFVTVEAGVIGSYSHGGRIGVLVGLNGGDEELARDLAMHIAASNPVAIDESGIDADTLTKERDIAAAQAAESGKPAEIVEKMVDGRMRKYVAEVTLLGQPFVKDPDQSVAKLLQSKGASVVAFQRLEVGEGIEKKVDNFAEEVMAQAGL